MRLRTSLRVGAVVLAVVLSGSYVAFRAAQARQGREAAAAASATGATTTSPSTRPATKPSFLMSGSKFSAVGYKNPYPNVNTNGAGFKLNNSVSAEFEAGSDICGGIPDLMPQTTIEAQPATAPSSSEGSRQP